MIEYSAESYEDVQPNPKYSDIYVIDDKKTDVQCYIRKFINTMYITFRGTDSKKDFINDLQFWKKVMPYKNASHSVKVHSGFIKAYRSPNVRNRIHSFITNDIDKIIIAGHSYGAALSILCADDLEYNFPQKDYEVFLFGSPRVGNKAFRDSYNKRIFKTFRIDNGNDIVTKIPFALLGYRHVGIKIHIGFPRILGAFSFKQHHLNVYYTNILKSYI